jgi:hypothetical protein
MKHQSLAILGSVFSLLAVSHKSYLDVLRHRAGHRAGHMFGRLGLVHLRPAAAAAVPVALGVEEEIQLIIVFGIAFL